MSVRFESMDADNVYAVCHDSQSNYNKSTEGRTVRVLRRIHIRLRPPVSRSQLALERVLFQLRIQPTTAQTRHRAARVVVRGMGWRALTMKSGLQE